MVAVEIVINSTHGAQQFAFACDYSLPVCIVPLGAMLSFLFSFAVLLMSDFLLYVIYAKDGFVHAAVGHRGAQHDGLVATCGPYLQ